MLIIGILLISPLYMILPMKNSRIFSLIVLFFCLIYGNNAGAHTLVEDAHAAIKLWSVITVACLLLVVIGLLMNNVRRTAASNAKLLELNNQITRQKDNLDQINHHLEEIINDRTRDLQRQNKKLSAYSSYLSHQIRGPIATLKGLVNLEREELIDKDECIVMINKCVSEIDEKIIEMSDMLHHPDKTS